MLKIKVSKYLMILMGKKGSTVKGSHCYWSFCDFVCVFELRCSNTMSWNTLLHTVIPLQLCTSNP